MVWDADYSELGSVYEGLTEERRYERFDTYNQYFFEGIHLKAERSI